MRENVLDDFADLTGWIPVASGLATLTISADPGPRGNAMRLDFDFRGGGGFVVARKEFSFSVPESYAFTFPIRGNALANRFELKLCDRSGKNVWWFRREVFALPHDWQTVRIKSSEIEFAWGPAGGGSPGEVGAIEFVIAAGPGGKGTVWIDGLSIEDRTPHSLPTARASSSLPGHEPRHALDGRTTTSWRSRPSDEPQWLSIDFGEEREYGGLGIDWERGGRARSFEVQASNDQVAWKALYSARHADTARSYVYLPASVSRHLRVNLLKSTDASGLGITQIEILPYDAGRSLNAFHQHIAKREPRGAYPKYFCGEQTYWSPVGVADGETCALLNEEGMVEVDRGTFSIEPFLFIDDRLLTWADVAVRQELARGYLPIPTSVWQAGEIHLRTTAFAARHRGQPVLHIRYRVENHGTQSRHVRLLTTVRPFQVTPPWQAFQKLGGVSSIAALEQRGGALWVDRDRAVIPLSPAQGFGAVSFDEGSLVERLRTGTLPPRKRLNDDFGHACGALSYGAEIPTGSAAEVYLAVPFGADRGTHAQMARTLTAEVHGAQALDESTRDWEARLDRVDFDLPAGAADHVATFRTAAAHILVNRDGPALQPGPRRYTRSWIRDGAIMAAALLRAGCADEAQRFIRWYAGFQATSGAVPCCVDSNGPDWLVEHDSHGELIFTVMECFRFTGDRVLLAELWPAVLKAVGHIEALRATRLGTEFEGTEKSACYGLLPESVSHEGYLAHPVHAYWDDFWALRGLSDAEAMAEALGEQEQARRIATLRDAFRETLHASIATTMGQRLIDYLPGSVEWADFDPTASANAVALLDEMAHLPRPVVEATFRKYLAGVRQRRANQTDWTNYSPYEIRIVGALVRLGWRQEANELLDFFLSDRRPLPWNQWPEIAWRDPKSPGHLGDLPHAWVAAEYMLAFRSLFAFESVAERALILAAGVPASWLEIGATLAVTDVPTYYGNLSFRLRRATSDEVLLAVSGALAEPAVTIIARPPLERPLTRVEVNGKAVDTFDASSVTISECPAEIRMKM